MLKYKLNNFKAI